MLKVSKRGREMTTLAYVCRDAALRDTVYIKIAIGVTSVCLQDYCGCVMNDYTVGIFKKG